MLLQKIGMSYVELEPIIPTDAPMCHSGPRPVPRLRKYQNVLEHSIAEVAEHNLQVVEKVFKIIHELNSSTAT